MLDDKRFDHESYGMVSLSRISSSGGHRLFMSALPFHHHSIRLRIHHGYLTRGEIVGDIAHAGPQIVEVELSAAQFAELITTMNVGDGVPCTIVRHGRSMEEPPSIDSEPENILSALPGGTSEKVRSKVTTQINEMVREITDHVPFALKMFQEATVRASGAAKAEVDALLTHIVQVTGMQVLRERAGLPSLPERTTPDPETERSPDEPPAGA